MWHVWQERNSNRILVGNLKKRGRLEDVCILKDSIKKMGWEGFDWIDLAQTGRSGRFLSVR
jgi:hypothetical protein